MLRLDAASGKLNWKRDANRGFTAFISLGSANHKLEYLNFDGKQLQKRIETITEKELFDDDSLETALALPITLGHPTRGRFDSNAEGLQVGSLLQEIKRDSGDLLVLAQVHDRRGIELIDRAISTGRQAEVSPGYGLTALLPAGDIYQQIGRRYDHVALLAPGMGRGGSKVAFRTDSVDLLDAETAVAPQLFFLSDKTKQKPMFKVTIAGREYTVEDQALYDAINALLGRMDSAEAAKATAEATVASLTGELEGTKTKLTEAENARLDSSALNAEIQLRLDTWAVVEPALRKDNKDFVRDNSLTVDEIRIAYLQKVSPEALKRLDSTDPNYSVFVSGLWEALKPQQRSDAADAIDASKGELDEIESNLRSDSIFPGDEARKAAIAKIEQAYKA